MNNILDSWRPNMTHAEIEKMFENNGVTIFVDGENTSSIVRTLSCLDFYCLKDGFRKIIDATEENPFVQGGETFFPVEWA